MEGVLSLRIVWYEEALAQSLNARYVASVFWSLWRIGARICVAAAWAFERMDGDGMGHVVWQEASAMTGEGLRDGLQWLVTEIRRSDRASLLRQRL